MNPMERKELAVRVALLINEGKIEPMQMALAAEGGTKYVNVIVLPADIAPGAAPEPTMYRLMHKEGAAWIPASEWMTEADPSWVKLAQDKPDEWCIKEPLDGKKVADAFRAAFAQAAPKEPNGN